MGELKLNNILWSIGVIALTFFILYLIKKFLVKRVAYTTKDEQHFNTFLGVLFNVLQYLVILIAILVVLKINGINITGLLAGLGIVATIVGLSLQDTLKDVFAGINIYNNNFYKVGDVVKWNGENCEVKYFNARVTKFKSIFTNSTYTVNNSSITSIEKVKDGRVLMITFDLSDPKDKLDVAFNNVAKKMVDDPLISNPYYYGIVNFSDNGVQYAIGFNAQPRDALANARVYQIIYDELAKIKIAPNTNDGIKIKNDPWDR